MQKEKKNAKHWIHTVVPTFAFAVGIVMSSIGGMMAINSTAKIFIFEASPYSYVSVSECRYSGEFLAPLEIRVKDIEEVKKSKIRSEKEIKKCIEDRKKEEKLRFVNNQKQSLVDGLSALIIGLILIFVFRKKNS